MYSSKYPWCSIPLKKIDPFTFIPRVEQTKSMMAWTWLEWKWLAISNSISLNDALIPLSLSKREPSLTSQFSHWITTASSSWLKCLMRDGQAISMHSPRQMNLMPDGVDGGWLLSRRNSCCASSSLNLRPAIPFSEQYNLITALACTTCLSGRLPWNSSEGQRAVSWSSRCDRRAWRMEEVDSPLCWGHKRTTNNNTLEKLTWSWTF